MLSVHTKQPAPASLAKEFAEELFQNLLVAYDSSAASETALQYAITLARVFDSFVTVVFVQPPSDLAVAIEGGLSRMKESYREIADELESVAQNLKAEGIRNRVMHRAGTVADVLVQLAAESETDLLLLGAHGHKKDLLRLGSTAEYMLRSMPCAVLTVGPEAVLHGRGVNTMSTLLYASSLPAKAGPAVDLVKALAKNFNARVEIIHGIASRSKAQDLPGYEQKAADEAVAEKLREQMQAAAVETTWKFISGLNGERIAERSREIHADLIVFGIEHHPADPAIMGMISAVIRQAECPVLTIPGPA